ncbi:MAG: hypothetical protein ACJA07_001219, partial [Rhodococcus sp. (in: high G+C Gram-positive bacteria)]
EDENPEDKTTAPSVGRRATLAHASHAPPQHNRGPYRGLP